jgi:hypothetical protein
MRFEPGTSRIRNKNASYCSAILVEEQYKGRNAGKWQKLLVTYFKVLLRPTFALLEIRTDNLPESSNTFHCCDTLGRSSLAQNELQYSNSTPTTVFHLYPVLSTTVYIYIFVGERAVMASETSFYRFQITISGRALCDHYLIVYPYA